MKIKHVLTLISCLLIFYNTEAQLLKKLKKKAEAAVERTLLKKTDETVSKKTEQAMDSMASGSKSKKSKKLKSTGTATVDLELDISVAPYIVKLNENTTFIIRLKNTGAVDASDISVSALLPSGYRFVNSQSTQGSYASGTGVWSIDQLASGASAQLTVHALVVAEDNLMYHTEVASCTQTDSDSHPNNGVDTDKDSEVVNDPDDEDDGDAQDVVIKKDLNAGSNSEPVSNPGSTTKPELEDIKLVLKDKKGETQYYYFDFEAIAMRVEFDKKKEPPMYFDYKGYVYVSEKKNNYIKVPFSQMKSMVKNMKNMFSAFGGNMPNAPAPNDPIDYYGMNLGPHKFPILEWAFIYKPQYFEGSPDLNEESLTCRGTSDCRKFTQNTGKDKGSYVLFDNQGRLAEIFSIRSGNAVYTYEDCTVILPAAQAMNLPFGN